MSYQKILEKVKTFKEDEKRDLQALKQSVQDEYDACVQALGSSHPRCQILHGILMDVCADLERVCGQLEGSLPAAMTIPE